jgi:hypothetical protein
MRRLMGLLLASILISLFYAIPARAQYGNLPNQAAWNQYLANHPQTAAELRANPSLIDNANWRSQHPHFESWASSHPEDWKAMRQPASRQNSYGASEKGNNQLHDHNWWYHHTPQSAYENHPDWWQSHRDWKPSQGEQHAEQKEEHAERKEQHAEQKYQQQHEDDHGSHGDYGHQGNHGNH